MLFRLEFVVQEKMKEIKERNQKELKKSEVGNVFVSISSVKKD